MSIFKSTLSALFLAAGLLTQHAHAAADDYAHTRYPIILVHGMGSINFHGVDYWYGIQADLAAHGATVYEANLAAFDDESVRGEQLIKQIRNVLAVTGASKVNLIAHSQGGLSSRYAAAIVPDLVASITSISTPHRGSPITTSSIAKLKTQLYDRKAGNDDMEKVMQHLSPAGTREFTRQFPSAGLAADCHVPGAEFDVISVTDPRTKTTRSYKQLLYSWAGGKPVTNVFDFTDLAFSVTRGNFQPGEVNDGLVSTCSAAFGKAIGVFPWNHADEINQYMGILGLQSAGKNNGANPVVVIRTHANRLKLAGL